MIPFEIFCRKKVHEKLKAKTHFEREINNCSCDEHEIKQEIHAAFKERRGNFQNEF